jgi:hypothetical protein
MPADLMDYTKFRLKPDHEIREVFERINRMFILFCGKCYKRFEEEGEEQYLHVQEVLDDKGAKAAGHVTIDFLCNEFLSGKKISGLDLAGCDSIGVVSCGLGIQFVAGLFENMPVYALADSLPHA